MKPAARLTDLHVCPMQTPGTPPIPHVGGPIVGPGAATVLVAGLPAACLGDTAVCVGPPDVIATGSSTVLIGGKPAARLGDTTAHGGSISVGAPTVMIGDSGTGSGGAAGATMAAARAVGAPFTRKNCAAEAALAFQSDPAVSPPTDPTKRSWIEVALVDDEGAPVANQRYRIIGGDGTAFEGFTGGDGVARVTGIDPGQYRISWPELEAEFWRPATGSARLGPVPEGGRLHLAAAGDCVLSIAARFGVSPAAIWDHPDNAELRRGRSDATILAPGDVVTVPLPRPAEFDGSAEIRHPFVLERPKTRLRLRMLDGRGDPRADLAYSLTVAGSTLVGTTTSGGFLEEWIPARAESATLIIEGPAGPETYPLRLGGLDPGTDLRTARQRLTNLGLYRGSLDGEEDDTTRIALLAFQQRAGLEPTGRLDAETLAALRDQHER